MHMLLQRAASGFRLKSWSQSHGLSKVRNGFISAVHLHQDISKIVVRSIIGPYFRGLSVVSKRFIELRLPRKDHAQTEVSVRLIQEDSQHFLKVRLRFIECPPERDQSRATQSQGR